MSVSQPFGTEPWVVVLEGRDPRQANEAIFVLRAIGDPRRAMYVTLVTAIANAVLDPIFIFWMDYGIRGAALATVCANLASFAVGLYALIAITSLWCGPGLRPSGKNCARSCELPCPQLPRNSPLRSQLPT